VKKQAAWRTRRTVVSLRALTTSFRAGPKARTQRDAAQRRQFPSRRDGRTSNDGIDDILSCPAGRTGRDRRDIASRRTRTLLSFQGPMPGRPGNKKASARARGLQFDGLRKRSYPNRAKALLGRRAFHCLPLGRPTECSRAPKGVKPRLQAARSASCRPAEASRRGARAAGRAPRPAVRRASRPPARSCALPRSSRARTRRR
jgi:hypothetical protein